MKWVSKIASVPTKRGRLCIIHCEQFMLSCWRQLRAAVSDPFSIRLTYWTQIHFSDLSLCQFAFSNVEHYALAINGYVYIYIYTSRTV
jgi:hypothetical protein